MPTGLALGVHDDRSGATAGRSLPAGAASGDGLDWDRDGRDWPNRAASRFVRAASMDWHLQEMGDGPALLLLHGTGASTHSWRGLAPLLATRFHLIAPDLPGHGFTRATSREFLSLRGMGWALRSLLREMPAPAVVLGHSAGAAIAVRMTLDGHIAPRLIVGVNAALLPLRGFPGQIFSPLARVLARMPVVPRLLARRFDREAILSMLERTGSRIDEEGVSLYARLAGSPAHVAAAFGMMAEWDLPSLAADLPGLRTRLVLIVGSKDGSISPADADRVRAIVPGTEIVRLEGLGHLAHEERPDLVADLVFAAAEDVGVLRRRGA